MDGCLRVVHLNGIAIFDGGTLEWNEAVPRPSRPGLGMDLGLGEDAFVKVGCMIQTGLHDDVKAFPRPSGVQIRGIHNKTIDGCTGCHRVEDCRKEGLGRCVVVNALGVEKANRFGPGNGVC